MSSTRRTDIPPLRPNPRDRTGFSWFFYSLVLALFLAAVLNVVQHFAIRGADLEHPIKDFVFRFLLNYFCLSCVVLLCSRWILAGLIVSMALFNTAVLYYASYYGRVPMLSVLLENAGEGIRVADAIFVLFPWKQFTMFLFLAALQLILLRRRDRFFLSWQKRSMLVLGCLICFGVLFCSLNRGGRSLKPRYANHATEEIVSKFGLTPVFCRDAISLYFLKNNNVLEAALEREKEQSDLLNDEFHLTMPRNIVVVQCESLDNAVLDHVVGGREVTPFLNRLSKQSMRYRIRANHDYGSATADFVLLNGIPPSQTVFNYNIPNFPYRTSLPLLLSEKGYRSTAVHGVHGSFYKREAAFERMKIDRIFFRQEIVETLTESAKEFEDYFLSEKIQDATKPDWLLDETVFAFANKLLDENQDDENSDFLFVITATSHTPFRQHPIRKIVPKERNISDRYLNAVNYLDGELGRFYERLPEDSLLIVYGDHTAYIDEGDFVSDYIQGRHYVPLIISVKGRDIAGLQKRERNLESIDVDFRDIHSYIRQTLDVPGERQPPRPEFEEPIYQATPAATTIR